MNYFYPFIFIKFGSILRASNIKKFFIEKQLKNYNTLKQLYFNSQLIFQIILNFFYSFWS
jgi:hypothetical protein